MRCIWTDKARALDWRSRWREAESRRLARYSWPTRVSRVSLVGGEVARAGVVDEQLEVHFGFAAEAFDVGEEMALVGADGAAQRLSSSAKVVAKRKGRTVESLKQSAITRAWSRAAVEASAGKPGGIFGRNVLGDDHREVAGGKEEGLVAEEAGNSGEGHGPAVAGKFREGLTFCDAVGVPRHTFSLQCTLMGLRAQSCVGYLRLTSVLLAYTAQGG